MKILMSCVLIAVIGFGVGLICRVDQLENKVDSYQRENVANTAYVLQKSFVIEGRVASLQSTLEAFRGSTTRRWHKEDVEDGRWITIRPWGANSSTPSWTDSPIEGQKF